MRMVQRPEPRFIAAIVQDLRALLGQLYAKDIESAEVGIVLAQCYWGVLLLLPPRTFLTSPGYRVMARLAREEVWGWGTLALAALPVVAFLWRSLTLRALGLLCSVSWFGFVTVVLLSGNRFGTGGIYALGILGGAWALRRVLEDHGDEIGMVRWLRAGGLRRWRARARGWGRGR